MKKGTAFGVSGIGVFAAAEPAGAQPGPGGCVGKTITAFDSVGICAMTLLTPYPILQRAPEKEIKVSVPDGPGR